jgi:hypothetical protein
MIQEPTSRFTLDKEIDQPKQETPEDLQRRAKIESIIEELIQTETAYLEDLDIMQQVTRIFFSISEKFVVHNCTRSNPFS